jgi:hypothetical protein
MFLVSRAPIVRCNELQCHGDLASSPKMWASITSNLVYREHTFFIQLRTPGAGGSAPASSAKCGMGGKSVQTLEWKIVGNANGKAIQSRRDLTSLRQEKMPCSDLWSSIRIYASKPQRCFAVVKIKDCTRHQRKNGRWSAQHVHASPSPHTHLYTPTACLRITGWQCSVLILSSFAAWTTG